MKIVVITGSAHKNGTSSLLADRFIEGATKANHKVFRFDAAFKQIHGCIGCDTCRTKHKGCIFKDDMEEINPHLLSADAIVFVSPIYYFLISAQLKLVMDRFYANNDKLLEKKSTALLMTMADDTLESAEGSIAFFKNFSSYMQWEIRGIISANNCLNLDDIKRTDFPNQAYLLGLNF